MQPNAGNKIKYNAFLILDNQVFPITKAITNIGRRLTNHLVIDNKRVSRSHAQIRQVRDRYFIIDLNSTGGTYLNERRINQAQLTSGDRISLADHTIIFAEESPDLKEKSETYTTPFSRKKNQERITTPNNDKTLS